MKMEEQVEKQFPLEEALIQADSLRYEGCYEEAEKLYLKILENDSDNAKARCGLGLVYCFHGGRFEESVNELRRAVMLEPTNITYRLHLAKTLTMLAMYEEAKTEFEQVLQLDPQNEEAIKQLSFLAEWGF